MKGVIHLKIFRFALTQMIPVLFSYIFVGIAFGMLAQGAGYSVFWTFMAGLFIYAGSMQLIMLSLITSGAPLYMIAVMTFFVNARHMFYGIGFIQRFRRMGLRYPYMTLMLTDELYSVLCSVEYPDDIDEQDGDFTIALTAHMLWVISCTAGALFGELIPFNMAGIEFSATAFFVTVCVNQWREFGSHIPVIAGFVSAIIFLLVLGPDQFILPALSVSLIVLTAMQDRIMRQMGGAFHDK